MSKIRVRCAFCGEEIDPEDRGTFQRVTGWQQNRAGGYGITLALREPRQEWACRFCIDKRRRGHEAQASLLE